MKTNSIILGKEVSENANESSKSLSEFQLRTIITECRDATKLTWGVLFRFKDGSSVTVTN